MFRNLIAASAAALALSGCVIVADGDDDVNVSYLNSSSSYITQSSNKSFSTTLADLQTAIDRRSLKTFAVIDHAAGGQSVGRHLPATTLIIFGNPQAGTPLIEEDRNMGLELPLRAMVWEKSNGDVMVSVTDIRQTSKRYDLSDQKAIITRIDGTLEGILNEATN